jgi:hypothetical protein
LGLVRKVTIALLVVLLLTLPACGGGEGDGDKTFEGDGYSFVYPEDWEEREIGEVTPGAVFLTAFAPAEGLDGLIFEINVGDTPVSESNIAEVQADVAGVLQESTEGPTRVSVAGLPGLRFISHPQPGLSRRVTTVFDGATAYVFDCGFTPDRAEEMEQGCDQIEQSFQIE